MVAFVSAAAHRFRRCGTNGAQCAAFASEQLSRLYAESPTHRLPMAYTGNRCESTGRRCASLSQHVKHGRGVMQIFATAETGWFAGYSCQQECAGDLPREESRDQGRAKLGHAMQTSGCTRRVF